MYRFSFITRVVELLLHHDARPGIRDDEGYDAVHYAALKGHKLSLEMVLEAFLLYQLLLLFIRKSDMPFQHQTHGYPLLS